MIKTRLKRQIIIDINTQKDYFNQDSPHRVRNHRRILLNIRRIMALARVKRIPVISICEANTPSLVEQPCVDGTEGAEKISYTLLNNRASFAADCSMDLRANLLLRYRQIILHSRVADPFKEERIDTLLSEVRANEFILIGALAEDAVKLTALGLLWRGKRVTVVADAVGCHDTQRRNYEFRKIAAKGAILLETKKIAGISSLKGKSGESNDADLNEKELDAVSVSK